ncbi:hypothetical protein PUN28_008381 [Cardiocondyla obscurior]|uniref:Uncharacterized protein n=1 Tax=Cardiocondyla obscurior TaxID=286306 RepID=A0AAW2FXG8_9HYME
MRVYICARLCSRVSLAYIWCVRVKEDVQVKRREIDEVMTPSSSSSSWSWR